MPKLRWMRLDSLNTFIIATWLGWLSVGINSSLMAYFTFGFLSQFYLRRYRPVFFSQWLLTITAAIGGGKFSFYAPVFVNSSIFFCSFCPEPALSTYADSFTIPQAWQSSSSSSHLPFMAAPASSGLFP